MINFNKIIVLVLFIVIPGMILSCSNNSGEAKMPENVYDFTVKDIDGNEVSLSDYKGKVMLVVNVASECGFTPQYEGLQKLYEDYKEQGLVVLGFPSNQFGSQEPGSNEEIQNFCTSKFNVTFPMFSKIDVNGDNADPFYAFIKDKAPGTLNTKSIKWNFTKFLIDKDGNVIERFSSAVKPKEIAPKIEEVLKG